MPVALRTGWMQGAFTCTVVLLIVMLCARVGWASVESPGPSPPVNWETYTSNNGEFTLDVVPSERLGRSSALCTLMYKGDVVWSRTFPFVLRDVAIGDDGACVGAGDRYEQIEGGYRYTGQTLVFLSPAGDLLREVRGEKSKGERALTGYAGHVEAVHGPTRAGWFVMRCSNGALLLHDATGQQRASGVLRSPIPMEPGSRDCAQTCLVRDTNLLFVEWVVADGGVEFTLLNLETMTWTPWEYSVPDECAFAVSNRELKTGASSARMIYLQLAAWGSPLTDLHSPQDRVVDVALSGALETLTFRVRGEKDVLTPGSRPLPVALVAKEVFELDKARTWASLPALELSEPLAVHPLFDVPKEFYDRQDPDRFAALALYAVEVDSAGRWLVLDRVNECLKVFDPRFTLVSEVALAQFSWKSLSVRSLFSAGADHVWLRETPRSLDFLRVGLADSGVTSFRMPANPLALGADSSLYCFERWGMMALDAGGKEQWRQHWTPDHRWLWTRSAARRETGQLVVLAAAALSSWSVPPVGTALCFYSAGGEPRGMRALPVDLPVLTFRLGASTAFVRGTQDRHLLYHFDDDSLQRVTIQQSGPTSRRRFVFRMSPEDNRLYRFDRREATVASYALDR